MEDESRDVPNPRTELSSPPQNAWVDFRTEHPVVFGFLVLGCSYGLFAIIGGVITFLVAGASITKDNVALMRGLQMGFQILLFLIPALLMLLPWSKDTVTLLRLRKPDPRALGWCVVAVLGVQFFAQGYTVGQDAVLRWLLPQAGYDLFQKFEKLLQGLYEVLIQSQSWGEGFYVWLVVALTPAICEETVFRGILQGQLERGLSPRRALLLTALLFAFVHFNLSGLLPLLGIGVLLGILVSRGGSLYYGMTAHLLNNTVAVIGVAVLGVDTITDSGLGTDGAAWQALVFALGGLGITIIALWFFLKRIASLRLHNPMSES